METKCDYLMTLESEIHQKCCIKKGELCELECLRNDVQYFEGTRNVHILNVSWLRVWLHTNEMLH